MAQSSCRVDLNKREAAGGIESAKPAPREAVRSLAHPRKAAEAQTVRGVSRSSSSMKKPPSPIASQSIATFVGIYARQRAPSLRPAAKESTAPRTAAG